MKCVLCKKGSPDLTTACGHHYHADCFRARWKECHLPCFECGRALGHAVQHTVSKEWVVGICGAQKWCSCYKVTADESKIVRTCTVVPRWNRENGRLRSRKIYPLCFNICVS